MQLEENISETLKQKSTVVGPLGKDLLILPKMKTNYSIYIFYYTSQTQYISKLYLQREYSLASS